MIRLHVRHFLAPHTLFYQKIRSHVSYIVTLNLSFILRQKSEAKFRVKFSHQEELNLTFPATPFSSLSHDYFAMKWNKKTNVCFSLEVR